MSAWSDANGREVRPGCGVRVLTGAFAGMRGTVTSDPLNTADTLTVQITVYGCPVPALLDTFQVELDAPPTHTPAPERADLTTT